jgi:prepilin-type processing-associated H-X9-DG protein
LISLEREGDSLGGIVLLLLPGEDENLKLPISSTQMDGDQLVVQFPLEGQDAEQAQLELGVSEGGLDGVFDMPNSRNRFPLTASKVDSATAELLTTQKPTTQRPVRAKGAAERSKCQNNLKQLGLVVKMFAHESKGKVWPRMDARPDRLFFLRKDVYPEYLTDPTVLVCPTELAAIQATAKELEEAPDRVDVFFDDHSYWFPGYALVDEPTGLAFVEEYRKRALAGLDFDEDLEVTTESGVLLTIYRLREGVERHFNVDISNMTTGLKAQSEIPVIIERPGHHVPKGGNVLFMDAHVEFIKYPGEFPMTERFIKALESLDKLPQQPAE